MKDINKNLYVSLEKFHSDNIFLDSRTIYFGGNYSENEETDSVNSFNVSQAIKNIHILDNINNNPITLLLNTPGGSWYSGMALFDSIKFARSKVYIVGMGQLFSMGAVLMQAGHERLLMSNTRVMIHDGSDGYIGTCKSFEAWAKDSEKVRHIMYNIFYERMKKTNKDITLDDIEKMCSHDKILNAEEAIILGLADRII